MFFEKQCQKKTKIFGPRCPKKKKICKTLNNKGELTNWAQNTKHKNTNLAPKFATKILKKPYFCSAKMGPSRGGTVPNSWGGTKTNSWKAKKWYQN